MYNEEMSQDDDEDMPFLPLVREGYKYLGLIQVERDTLLNFDRTKANITNKIVPILQSKLAPAQKIHMINTSVIPAILYVMGNIYLREARASTLAKCDDLDKEIRKLLVNYKLHGRTCTRASVYLPKELSGLGLHSIKFQTEIQYIKKYVYLEYNPEMEEIRARYERLASAEWRNPLTDARAVLQKYNIELPPKMEHEETNTYARRSAETLKKHQILQLQRSWESSYQYARLVGQNKQKISFPAYTDIRLEDWMYSLIRAATEEQVIGPDPATRRRCRYGCNAYEDTYHVVSNCPVPAFTTRHDQAVHYILREILVGTEAPEDVLAQLPFGKAIMVSDYSWRNRQVKVRAGVKIKTNPALHHNRPDIVICLTNPNEVFVLEIAISHLRNIREQEQLKKVRYKRNSQIEITPQNYKDAPRSLNICEALGRMYKAPVKFGVLVLGALGEILRTEDHVESLTILNHLGVHKVQWLLRKCSVSICEATAKILVNRLN